METHSLTFDLQLSDIVASTLKLLHLNLHTSKLNQVLSLGLLVRVT